MSLSKTPYPLLSTGMVQPRKTRPSMTEKLLAGTLTNREDSGL